MYFSTGCSVIDRLLKPVLGEAVLDVGCGTGRLTFELASRVGISGRVVGVDLSDSRIRVARAANDSSHVKFLVGSVREALPFGPFDAVFSNYVFHWFERSDRPAILKDIYESLKPDGRLAFCVLPPQTQSKFIAADTFALAMPDKDYESTLGVKYDPSTVWLQLCTEAGFAVEVCKEYDDEKRSPNLETFLKNLELSVPNFKPQLLKQEDLDSLKNSMDMMRKLCTC